jgi:hypothetical protein
MEKLAFTKACDERLDPDLPRGRDKLISGDFDVDDEGSKQNIKLL